MLRRLLVRQAKSRRLFNSQGTSIVNKILYRLTIASVMVSAGCLQTGQALASTRGERTFITPAQAHQFSRDLIRSDSQDFFNQGRERLEREIQILNQQRFSSSTPLLKVDENLKGENISPVTSPSFLAVPKQRNF